MCMQMSDVSGVADVFKCDVSGVANVFQWDVSGEQAARPNTARPASERHGQRGGAASERRGQIRRDRRAGGTVNDGATGERAE